MDPERAGGCSPTLDGKDRGPKPLRHHGARRSLLPTPPSTPIPDCPGMPERGTNASTNLLTSSRDVPGAARQRPSSCPGRKQRARPSPRGRRLPPSPPPSAPPPRPLECSCTCCTDTRAPTTHVLGAGGNDDPRRRTRARARVSRKAGAADSRLLPDQPHPGVDTDETRRASREGDRGGISPAAGAPGSSPPRAQKPLLGRHPTSRGATLPPGLEGQRQRGTPRGPGTRPVSTIYRRTLVIRTDGKGTDRSKK